MDLEERLIDLEMKLAFAEKESSDLREYCETLNRSVLDLEKEVGRLRRRLEELGAGRDGGAGCP